MRFGDWLEGITYKLLQGSLEEEVMDVVYDSRKAVPGVVFVCMKGARIDSHDFIPDVVSAGVRVLVVEETSPVPEGVTVIHVANSREALARLSAARFDHPSRKMVSIGVTGTKGKTTATHMIKAVLESAGKRVGLIGTNGVVIGTQRTPTVNTTPESYQLQESFAQMVEAGCEYMIMEVSSQGVKMHRIDGIMFDYGVFLNLSPDHIGPDEHADFAEYLNCKAQLFSRCKVGIINRDDVHAAEIINQATCPQLYDFSLNGAADFRVDHIHYLTESDFIGLEFAVDGKYKIDLRVNIPGKFNVYNALAAVSVCSFFELPKEKISHALEHLNVDGRMEIAYVSERCTVIIDYAHNAISMESMLNTLRDYNPKRLVCVFGCGGNRSKDRRYFMGDIGARMADFCIITADNSRYEKVEDIMADIRGSMEKARGNFIEIEDRREAIEYSILHAKPGDMVAIIGKGHEDYQEINGVRHPFLDRAVVDEVVSHLS